MEPRFIPYPQGLPDGLQQPQGSSLDPSWDDLHSGVGNGEGAVAGSLSETGLTSSVAEQALDALPQGLTAADGDIAMPLAADDNLYPSFDDNLLAPSSVGEGSGGLVTATVLPSPSAQMPAPVFFPPPGVSPALTGATEVGLTRSGIGYGGTIEALAHTDHQIFYLGPAAAAAPDSVHVAATAVSAGSQISGFAPTASADLANPSPLSTGPATDASIGSHGATAAQVQQALDESGLSVNGTGVKVGVLSDSFNDLGGAAADEADGALPSSSNVQVLEDAPSGGADEGRAMMQIVHDIAPGASLAFYTAFESEQDFANGILALAAAGCKVICDDVSYYDEPFFQNGVVAQAIQTVEAEGVTYIAAAGNDASNGYQAAWTPISGTFDGTNLTDAESFNGSLVQTISVTATSTNDVPLLLEWNQAYGSATSDLEILVFHNGSLVGTATNRSVGEPTNPWTGFDFTASGTYQVAIENLSGPNPGLIKEIAAGDGLPVTISGANAGTVYGHAMTPGVITAGAVSAADTPAFGFSTPVSESFSSSGAGSELLFANNGAALSSPDMLNPVALSGVDDISTTVSGSLSDFYGTSAASASLAGVAALILAANPSLNPAQVEQILEQTATPIANSAVSGAGLVNVDAAVAAAENLIPRVIESFGSTSLVETGNNYFLDSISTGNGPELRYGGAPVTAGEFVVGGSTWAPIGTEATATGYEVAFKLGSTNEYSVWATDSSGNYTSNLYMPGPGNSTALESLETSFHQDLNGDGAIGIPVTNVIQTDTNSLASTSLVATGTDYYLENAGTGLGPELYYQGAAVTSGEFVSGGSTWTLIGAALTSTGYEVAFKLGSTDEYSVWATDSNGNYTSNLYLPGPGNSTALESLETSFHQDLNGDGTIGVVCTAIQSDTNALGSVNLITAGNNYYLANVGAGIDSELTYQGAPVTAGEFAIGGSTWAPIGVALTSTGYEVAWKLGSTNEYSVWATDSHGNYTSNLYLPGSGSNAALEALEQSFHQDLNGDGTIGVVSALIQTDTNSLGPTSLVASANNYYLENAGTGQESLLYYQGAPVTAGEFVANGSTWMPIGVALTSTGYEVAWKLGSTNEYSVWATDSSGHYTSNLYMPGPGNSAALETLETSFHQDLNGDGTIGIPGSVQASSSIKLAPVNDDSFLFASGANIASPGSQISGEAGSVAPALSSEPSAIFHDGATFSKPAAFVWSAADTHENTMGFEHHDSVAQANPHFMDLHAGFIIVH